MARAQTMDEMAKLISDKVLEKITINGKTLHEVIEILKNASVNSECHLTTCKNNKDCHCTQDDMRKQCAYTALLILCLDGDKCEK